MEVALVLTAFSTAALLCSCPEQNRSVSTSFMSTPGKSKAPLPKFLRGRHPLIMEYVLLKFSNSKAFCMFIARRQLILGFAAFLSMIALLAMSHNGMFRPSQKRPTLNHGME